MRLQDREWDLVIYLPVEPVAKGRPRVNTKTKRAYTPAKTRTAEKELKALIDSCVDENDFYAGAVEIEVEFRIPRPKSVSEKKRKYPTCKPDADNLIKLVKDCLGSVWRDDSQVCKETAIKIYATEKNPMGIVIRIRDFVFSEEEPFYLEKEGTPLQ